MWILLLIMLSTGEPEQPTVLMHKTYTTELQCIEASLEIHSKESVDNLKVSTFCVSQKDILSN